ncbi:MAG: AlpA family phage regulatory protein [Limnohabitans sp.]|uniref:helix-turn-helix transcriptional regulator n=1 Tax=Limnohabitans sp. TaxID=1907725 RepID=UPI003BAEE9FC
MNLNDVLPATGYVRQSQLVRDKKRPGFVAPIPVCAATLWRWVGAKKFPAPHKLSEGVTAWKVEEVRAWLEARSPK